MLLGNNMYMYYDQFEIILHNCFCNATLHRMIYSDVCVFFYFISPNQKTLHNIKKTVIQYILY